MRLRRFAGAIGALLLGVGVVFMYEPALVETIEPLADLRARLQGVSTTYLLVTTGGLLAGYAVLAAWAAGSFNSTPVSGTDKTRYDAARETPPEAVVDESRTQIQELSSEAFQTVGTRPDEVANVQSRLQGTVYAALAVTEDDPDAAIHSGNWTDSRLAATYLSEDDDLAPSVWSRLRMWLHPEQERQRRLEVTLAEVERLVEDQTGGDR